MHCEELTHCVDDGVSILGYDHFKIRLYRCLRCLIIPRTLSPPRNQIFYILVRSACMEEIPTGWDVRIEWDRGVYGTNIKWFGITQ